MIIVSVITGGFTIYQLYETAIEEENARLKEIVSSNSQLIEAVGRFDAMYSQKAHPKGPAAATLSQVENAYKLYKGFGKTGEFVLATRKGNNIVFLLKPRFHIAKFQKIVSFNSKKAKPMQLALNNLSGVTTDLDYRGKLVLAAYSPIKGLNWGLVAKIDLDEIKEPFIRAGLISGIISFIFVFIGSSLFYLFTSPLINKLVESESRLKAVIDNSLTVIYLKDPLGRYILINSRYEELFNISKEQIIGKTDYDIFPNETANQFKRNDQDVLKSLMPIKSEEIVPMADGIHTYFSVKFPLLDAYGKPYAIGGMSTDITDRIKMEKALQKNESVLRTIFENAAIGIGTANMEGQIIEINSAFAKMLGYTKEELKNISFRDFTHPDDIEIDYANLMELIEGKRDYYQLEKRYIRKDKKTIWGNLTVSLIPKTGDILPFVVGIIENITMRKQAEEIIDQQISQLQKVNKELEEFSYVASHDLQEPLRTLSSYCTLLEKDIGDNLPPRAQEDITFIKDAANRMKNLVSDLLQLSRAGRFQYNMKAVDLNRCVNDVITDLQSFIEDTNSKVEWDNLPTVLGDENQLARVFQNLIKNGIKFHSDKPPLIKISAKKMSSNWEITVSDNGIGIEEQYLDQIFLPFKRLHGMGKYEGTGIGLTICRKIIQRHEGEISVESILNEGSKFKFTLKDVSNKN